MLLNAEETCIESGGGINAAVKWGRYMKRQLLYVAPKWSTCAWYVLNIMQLDCLMWETYPTTNTTTINKYLRTAQCNHRSSTLRNCWNRSLGHRERQLIKAIFKVQITSGLYTLDAVIVVVHLTLTTYTIIYKNTMGGMQLSRRGERPSITAPSKLLKLESELSSAQAANLT